MPGTAQILKAAIFGGSGYGGAELIRILLSHPNAEIALVTGNESAGRRIDEVHRNLLGFTDLVLEPEAEGLAKLDDVDVVFLALPHGKAMSLFPDLPKDVKVIDLSGDFRLSDSDVFEQFYGFKHEAMEDQSGFVYGLTEVNREQIVSAERVSNPGCFATAVLLALHPAAGAGLLSEGAVVDAKTGSSGSGARAAANTHHPERAGSFYAYKPFRHQHLPEIEQSLGGSAGQTGILTFMTHSLPVPRGIFASCYFNVPSGMDTEKLSGIYKEFYGESFFVRIVEGSPNINWVKMTNFCDIAVHADNGRAVVFSAIDNLVKGAAGQAVQNMNLMFGLPETAGLAVPGTNP